ncbi:MAG: hypothetical protein E7216_04900 [Clostridium thermopalmarium]|uniref:hypothetical protein n=1 Tax=Clostridium thermopalmarium TaxID=29373 RepID=UPI002356E3C1|nr:hypothetical protein [Clostridium thermopalmarium]MBE6043558.1 hypothetical protein [Clostridium thermopalmarium]
MINVEKVFKRLEKMIGSEFNTDEIIIAFESEEEVIINEVVGQESNFEGHGLCTCYNAYEDVEDSEIFKIYVDKNNIIVYVG